MSLAKIGEKKAKGCPTPDFMLAPKMIAIPKIEGQCTKVNPSQMLTTQYWCFGIKGVWVFNLFQKIYASHLDFIVKETPQKVEKIVTYGFFACCWFFLPEPSFKTSVS